MATVQVTGTLADFGRGNLAARSPELVFTLSGPTVTPDRFVLSAVPVTVTPAADGSFTAALEATDEMNPRQHYTVQIRLLDPAAGYVHIDFPDWTITVPAGGGAFPDLINGPLNIGWVWIVPGGAIPAEARSRDLLWDPSTDDVFTID